MLFWAIPNTRTVSQANMVKGTSPPPLPDLTACIEDLKSCRKGNRDHAYPTPGRVLASTSGRPSGTPEVPGTKTPGMTYKEWKEQKARDR